MKKVFTYLVSFIIMFTIAYLILCYCTGLRIKLDAPPMEYFVESIKHMVFFKSLVSSVVGLFGGGILYLIQRRKNN